MVHAPRSRSRLRQRRLALALAPLAVLAACSVFGETRVGSGVCDSETRPVADFERVRVAGAAVVDLRVGSPAEVRITYDDNLLTYVQTGVEGGTLEVRLEGSADYRTREPLHVEIVAPTLTAISGAGSVRIDARDLDCEHLELSVAGSGEVRAQGRATALSVDIAGSGDMDLREVQAERASVSIRGSGSVQLSASAELDVSISGSGDVAYLGEPVVSQSVIGSGDVRRLAPR
jgi:hypothetical protein